MQHTLMTAAGEHDVQMAKAQADIKVRTQLQL